ncbi:hypothetical protein [Caballeronia sp. LZ016]|uniref:hypothetical protein n=1 Tax=Caballeronia sp. LZ016 TaxID=3038554 RepID=UPI0028629953|nr:hypothetical protein [Caballeronia sp. LZ016]MDR5739489.1 hypothetical protein [Caballeronia sp. LZ016]
MTKKDFLFLGAVIYLGWLYQRSHSGTSALESAYQRELETFALNDGTNWTQSVWDASSGQPSYMFGTVPAQGGLSVQATGYGSVFGHI